MPNAALNAGRDTGRAKIRAQKKNIPSKTSEEIKKALSVCCNPNSVCEEDCTYADWNNYFICRNKVMADALAYIRQLECERDAAVEELKGYGCTYCKRLESPDESMCGEKCADFCNWEWRGVEEKMKDENS